MKRIVMLVVASFVLVGVAHAKINEQDLKKQVTLTEEASLLTQVDAVSLYMSSDKVAHAPRLGQDKVIEVETTILSPSLIGNETKMKNFVTRQIDTFIKVLKERLPIYAPSVASTFDPSTDIRFVIDAGGERRPVARWENGKWEWDSKWNSPSKIVAAVEAPAVYPQASPAPAPAIPVVEKKGKLSCDCPARKSK